MKIVEIVPQLSSGGAERFTVDLCNELSKDNEVTLIVLHSIENNGFYASEISSNVNVISVNKKKGFDISLFFRLKKVIKEIAPDIVHTHLRAIVYAFWSALTMKNISFFHTVHNDAEKEAGDRLSKFIRKYCFKRNLVSPITISEESDRSFTEFYGRKATMIFNGRNIPSDLVVSDSLKEEFKQYVKSDKTRVIVNLARIMPQKNQTMFAKVVDRLTKEGYDFTLLIIGNKSDSKMVEEIESYKCPNIHLLGEKHNPLEYLKLAGAYSLSSEYEGMPISLIEAMGVGAIPICTPVGGIVDVIENGKNGFLSKDTSEEEFYKTLKQFLDVPNSGLEKIKAETLKSYAPFSMSECASKYIINFKK